MAGIQAGTSKHDSEPDKLHEQRNAQTERHKTEQESDYLRIYKLLK